MVEWEVGCAVRGMNSRWKGNKKDRGRQEWEKQGGTLAPTNVTLDETKVANECYPEDKPK